MFTGIIQSLGKVSHIDKTADDLRVNVDIDNLDMSRMSVGDSVCVSGVCVTVVEKTGTGIIFDLSNETLSCTTFGQLKVGNKVNIELAMQISDRLDGHIVAGHVDTVGKLISIKDDGRSKRFKFEVPEKFSKYICSKGSICIDGVSLTVNSTEKNTFSVNVIPHTLQHTTFSDYGSKSHVNIEVDIISRYLERLAQDQ